VAMKQVGSHLPWEPFIAYVDDGHNEGIAEKLVRCIFGRDESLLYGARDLVAGCRLGDARRKERQKDSLRGYEYSIMTQ
jgi:hypothetical protein